MQTSELLRGFATAAQLRLRVTAAFGGVSINPQMLALRGGVDLLVATPGRLLDTPSFYPVCARSCWRKRIAC